MKLKSSKTTCYFTHAILLIIVSRVLLLKSVCQTISQSIFTHNTPTFYSNAYNRSGINFFLEEVTLWYSIYVLLAQIRTTWVATTYLFTYALSVNLKHTGLHKSVSQKGPILRSKRGKFSTSKTNTYVEIRNPADSKFVWKPVELSELKANLIYLDTIQWTLKSSPKDIRTKVFVLSCRRNATQFEAHSTNKRMLGTKFFRLNIKQQLYV